MTAAQPTPASRPSGWRVAAAVAVLGTLAFFGFRLTPIYLRNMDLQRDVEEITQAAQNGQKSDDLLRTWVVEKAAAHSLPVKAENVQIKRSPEGLGIDVRYAVRVDLPVYTVDLHFHPSAGVR